MKKVLSLALAVLLIASVIVSVPITASAFNVDNYKANITKISIGAPITGTDGKKYLPATVYFTANENLGDSNAVSFLEGYLKGMLANEDKFNGISGLGMTLMGPLKPDALEGMGSNAYSWQWSEGYGEGILKYNIPLKEDGDTQTIEQSLATGQQEVNCVDKDDKISFSIETVMNTDNFPSGVLPEGGSLFSDERTITIEDITKYPKTVEFGNTCTITVHYVYADGSQAAPDVVETYEIGFINYMIESPTIEGYTPDRIGVTGLPSGDKEETVTYTKNLPDLSTAQVTGLSEDENKKYNEEEAKNIGLEGLVKDVDYTSSVTTDTSGEKWIVKLEPVEGKSTGEKVIELKKAKDTCTITVHYVYADGSQAAPDVVETYEIGFINYMIESPTIEGYTPDRIGVTGLPSGDKEETVTYTKNLPDLSTAQVTGLSEDENKEYTEDEAKNIGLEGLTKDVDYTSSVTTDTSGEKWIVKLEPVEGKSTGEKVIELKKAKDTCTITVHYVYADGSQAAPDVVETYEIGFINYMIESPTIEGYTPDRIGVTGLPSGDKEETVTYTKNADNPVIEPAPVSKDISLDEASWTKGTGEDAEIVLKGTVRGAGWAIGDAYAKLEGPLSSQDCDAIWTGQKDVDTTITDNGDGTFSFVFSRALYWLGDKLPTASSKMTLMMSFWKDGKEYVSNQLTVGLGETAKKTAPATTVKASASKTKIYVGGKLTVKAEVKNGMGKTTYTSSNKKVATVDKNGKVKGISKGTAVVTVKNNGVKKSVRITVVKKSNTMTVKTKTVKAKAEKKMVFKKSKAFSIKKAQGKVTFKKLKGNKKIAINKKTGKLTVKKGLEKGKTYKVKIKIFAAGNVKYKSKAVTKTVKIKVK